jgi:hypothetical protein
MCRAEQPLRRVHPRLTLSSYSGARMSYSGKCLEGKAVGSPRTYPCDLGTDDTPKVRFSATLTEEPEVEVGLGIMLEVERVMARRLP